MIHSTYPIPSAVYEDGKSKAIPLYYYEELCSTNLTAKEIFFAESEQNRRFIVLADRQTAGRGRLGRSFFSEGGLYFSIAVPAGSFSLPAELLTTAAAAAVCAMGLAGEIAHKRLSPLDGNSSYRNYIIDAIYNMTPAQLEEGAKYEVR